MYSTAPSNWTTRWGGVLLLCREALGVLYSPSRLDHSWGWGLTPLQRSTRCTLQPQPTGPLVGVGSYSSAEKHSVYSTAPADWTTRGGGVLLLCREALGVLYSPSRLDHSWGWGLTPLQRSTRCTLQPQPTGPLVGVGSYSSAEKHSVYSTAPADWTSHWGGVLLTRWGGVFIIYREAVGVFYSPNRLGSFCVLTILCIRDRSTFVILKK